ncbi:hypothetical protein GPECTOR_6g692 [Gonium pectorale]|uniref:Uncharacterized protein n=1 Tax=Gonium pectorale TaxID=33097 RepID=A0A150GVF3_GONPE|nr:hypothetical protein GPECTOR_6g692 [Gonium pectorale]|eukprot:KXZ53774.1 hypothetical protein GPECTOR_6g692 [Gonium pectorale]
MARQRDREEGRIPPEELPGGMLNLEQRIARPAEKEQLGGSSYEFFPLSSGAGPTKPAGLSGDQLEGAVHLVSDVTVWKEILAAREAEERRQHAIAELHLHHAARIIQRSWRTFVRRRRDEKARLDALVSPDVQALLSAAAYKAMRDARNKLALDKFRRSLSRRARGFGSTMPRDIVPLPRTAPSRKNLRSQPNAVPMGRHSLDADSHGSGRPSTDSSRAAHGVGSGASGKSSRAGTGTGYVQVADNGGTNAASGGADSGAAGGVEGGEGRSNLTSRNESGLGKVRSFVAKSAEIIKKLVSFRDPRAEAEAAAAAAAEEEEEEEEKGEKDEKEMEEEEEAEKAGADRGVRGAANAKREAAKEGHGEAADEDAGESGTAEGPYADAEEDEGADEGDDDSLASGDDPGDEGDDADGGGESVEDAMAEAEAVVELAAELAEAILGGLSAVAADDGEGEGESYAADGADAGERTGGAASRAAPADKAAAGAEELEGSERLADDADAAAGTAAADGDGSSVPALPPLRSSGTALSPTRELAGSAGRGSQAPGRSLRLSEESAIMRQVIAGALAAAAAPVLGRSGALAVAELGLGAPLEAKSAKGSPRSAAARLRPSANGQAPRPHPHSASPHEIRAAAAVETGLASPTAQLIPASPPPHVPQPAAAAAEGCDLALPSLASTSAADRPGSSGGPSMRVSGLGGGLSGGGAAGAAASAGVLDGERTSPSMPSQTEWPFGPRVSQTGEACTFAVRERRMSAAVLPAVPTSLPAVVPFPVSTSDAPLGELEGIPLVGLPRQARASLPSGVGAGFGGGSGSASPSPGVSPDGHAAVAAASSPQPWAVPRQRAGHLLQHLHHPPPPRIQAAPAPASTGPSPGPVAATGGGEARSPVRRQPRGSNASPGRLVEVKLGGSVTTGTPGLQSLGLLINGVQGGGAAQTLTRAHGRASLAAGGANEPASPGRSSYITMGGPSGPSQVRVAQGSLHTGLSPAVPRARS